jgi:hypothetical protein
MVTPARYTIALTGTLFGGYAEPLQPVPASRNAQ